jgi:hypothetical protein
MASKDLAPLRSAIAGLKTETSEYNAVVRTLAYAGYTKKPKVYKGRTPQGDAVRVFVFEGTPFGTFLYVGGPSIVGEIQTPSGKAAKGLEEKERNVSKKFRKSPVL